jgi:hypothetical protein
MKIRVKKRRVTRTKLTRQFVKDIRKGMAEAKAGKLTPFQFGFGASKRKRYTVAELMAQCDPNAPMPADLQEWDRLQHVGREFGSDDYERLLRLDALADLEISSRVQELNGMLRKPDEPVSVERMNQAIAAHAVKEDDSG